MDPNHAAQRTERYLRRCEEMADLGMDLLRLAAARARESLAETRPAESAVPNAEPNPATRIQSAKPAEAAAPTFRAPSLKPICPAQLFLKLAAMVRDCAALNARLSAAPATSSPTPSASALRADPRRADLLEGFRLITDRHPQKLDLRRETMALMDHELAADPAQKLDMPSLFFRICDELHIDVDFALLPDKYLGAPPPHPP